MDREKANTRFKMIVIISKCMRVLYSQQLYNSYCFAFSTVISSLSDPVPGWIENFNGPVGILIGGGKGVLRVVLGNPNVAMDYMPVDIAVKIMCAAAWEKARSG